LFKRDKTWWVKVAVPRPLRDVLGYDLRRSLHTHDIEAAREARWEVIEEFRGEIDKVRSEKGSEDPAEKDLLPGVGSGNGSAVPDRLRVDQHIVEIVSDSGEGAQKCGQIMGMVSGQMGNGDRSRAPAESASAWARNT
jgi:hypothetical protein